MIEFKNVAYRYGRGEDKTTALKDVDLVVEEGEFVVILGPNGSGKSTLARLINGLLIPSQGEVLVDGLSTRDAEAIWDIRQRVGMVFQNPDNQLVATSVEEDVAFGPENLGVGPAEIRLRVREALEIVDMASYASFEPHLLSGGQKQRVAIAGALAMNPKYLVFDEAASMLDPKGRAEVTATLKRLSTKHGITVLSITHIPEEVALADRVIILSAGSVITDASPSEAFSDVSTLISIGVGIPKARMIAEELILAGVDLPRAILTVDELVAGLC